MNETLQRIERLRESSNLSIYKLCNQIGIAQSTYNTWTQKDRVPKSEALQKIADYFGVTVDYLLTGKDKEWEPELTAKDEKDIKKAMDNIKNQLACDTGLMYDGEPIDEESQQAILAAIEVAERTAVLESKRKFTPNKYKK